MQKYNKLVRDNIPDYIKGKGEAVIFHIATEQEYWQKLKEKIGEEAVEFSKNESIDELADILEIIDAIIDYKQFDRQEIEKVKVQKAEKKGKFSKRIILDES
ncbi:nucleoside triphosphate pyrophosphohydrolase [Candidatus Parcubacteria bacterium]|nr:nucleoside triphosphate pyrophosphohydrolase [Candidatus Parcubacteria bacterium]